MSDLRNDFDQELMESLFSGVYTCWACNVSHADCGHHIVGRGQGESTLESSPLNFAPLNNWSCHMGKSFDDNQTADFLWRTLKFLKIRGYELTEKDNAFIEKYIRLYELGQERYHDLYPFNDCN